MADDVSVPLNYFAVLNSIQKLIPKGKGCRHFFVDDEIFSN